MWTTDNILRRMAAFGTCGLAAMVLYPDTPCHSGVAAARTARPIYGDPARPVGVASTHPTIVIRADPPKFVPKTERGRKLWALRQAAIAKGMKLLSDEEIADEIRRRRGGEV